MRHKKLMRMQHKADCKRQPESTLQACHLNRHLKPYIHPYFYAFILRLSNHFITSYVFSQSCVGFHQLACYWFSLLQRLQWHVSDSWVVHYIEVVNRKTESFIRGRKKWWVVNKPCKAGWQLNFSLSLKNESHFFSVSRQLTGKKILPFDNFDVLQSQKDEAMPFCRICAMLTLGCS